MMHRNRRSQAPRDGRQDTFVESVPVWKAIEETAFVAHEMNGEPLPHWNGIPARIILPGWTGTYWMKHIDQRHDQAVRRLLDEVSIPACALRLNFSATAW